MPKPILMIISSTEIVVLLKGSWQDGGYHVWEEINKVSLGQLVISESKEVLKPGLENFEHYFSSV